MKCHKSRERTKAQRKRKKKERFVQSYTKQILDVLGLKLQGYSHEKVTEVTECPADIINLLCRLAIVAGIAVEVPTKEEEK